MYISQVIVLVLVHLSSFNLSKLFSKEADIFVDKTSNISYYRKAR